MRLDLGHFKSISGVWAWIWAIIGLFRESRPIFVYFEGSVPGFGPLWAYFGSLGLHFGTFRTYVLGSLSLDLGHLEPSLEAFWAYYGALLIPSEEFRAFSGHFGSIWRHFMPGSGPFWQFGG